VINRTAMLVFEVVPGRRRRLRLLEKEPRLAAASEVFRQEVFKHHRVLGPAGFPLESRINFFNKSEFAAIYKGAPK
jgi:hypothetical protein